MPSMHTPGSRPAWTCCRIQYRETLAMSAACPTVTYLAGSIFMADSIADRPQVSISQRRPRPLARSSAAAATVPAGQPR